jgi:ketosteroid isomerase-like protein
MRRLLLALPAVIALAIVPVRGHAQSAPDPRVERAVRAAVDSFSSAVARGDAAGAIHWLHPRLEVFESGYADDLAHYRKEHLPADIAYLREVRVRTVASRVTVNVTGGMALYTAETESSGTHDGQAVHARGTETMVLLHTANGWRILHIHWSSRR